MTYMALEGKIWQGKFLAVEGSPLASEVDIVDELAEKPVRQVLGQLSHR